MMEGTPHVTARWETRNPYEVIKHRQGWDISQLSTAAKANGEKGSIDGKYRNAEKRGSVGSLHQPWRGLHEQ